MDLLGSAHRATGADAAAAATASAAVRLAEQGRTPADAWLLKGLAQNSYRRLLTQAVHAGDVPASYAYLAALREPAVAATEQRPEHSLVAAQAMLALDPRRRCVLSSANGYPVRTSSACWTPRDCACT